jgi:hypothetical protein
MSYFNLLTSFPPVSTSQPWPFRHLSLNDLFSLPQTPDGEVVNGLLVVHVSEDAEVPHSLLTLPYPIPSLILPVSYETTLALLATSQKYNMDTVLSTVRRELVLPTMKAAFHAYAIARSKQLIPEMETAARVTLDHPMTFATIIDALPSFEGSALHNLVHFRERCRDNLLSFLVDGNGSLSNAWNNCRRLNVHSPPFKATKASSLGGFVI